MEKLLLMAVICASLISCNNSPEMAMSDQQFADSPETEKTTSTTSIQQEYFAIESAYIKYRNNAAGQEMIREWWFDQHGNRQYEENYFFIMGEKTGSKSIVMDGYQYQWDYDSDTGTKRRFYQAVTDYDKVSEKDIKRYGIEKHGYEEVLGKQCLKVSTEKPAKSVTWVWNNIPLKTEAIFGGNKVTMEAIEISTDPVDAKLFELPLNVTFTEPD